MGKAEAVCEVVINEDGTLCAEPLGKVKSRAWCAGHLQRFYRHGDVDGLRPLKGRNKYSTCEVINRDGGVCGEPSAWPNGKYGDLCRPHAEASRKYGDPLGRAERRDHGDTCELVMPDGTICPNPYDGKIGGTGVGMCTLHLSRARNWGDPRVGLPVNYHLGRKTCIVVLDYEPRKGEVCGLLVTGHEMCAGHHQRNKSHGDPQADKPLIPSDIEGDDRFLYRANPANGFIRLGDLYDGTPCHHWLGAKNKRGYGVCGAASQVPRSRLVHRRIWQTLVGPIPAGSHIDHQCHTHDCLNIEHLRCLSAQEHVRATRLFVDMAAEIQDLRDQIERTK